MTKFLEKTGFKLSFPTILLLIAALLYGILLFSTRHTQSGPKLAGGSIRCNQTESTNIAGIKIDCNLTINQMILLSILGLIVCGPSLIISKIFSDGTIPKESMIISIIFSFLVYFLIDYLIKIISGVITRKYFKKK